MTSQFDPTSSLLDQSLRVAKAEAESRGESSELDEVQRIKAYKLALTDLAYFLDAGDLSILTDRSVEIYLQDIRRIIGDFRKIVEVRKSLRDLPVQSVDGILEHLRDARRRLNVVGRYLELERTMPKEFYDRIEKLYMKLDQCRDSIEKALKLFS